VHLVTVSNPEFLYRALNIVSSNIQIEFSPVFLLFIFIVESVCIVVEECELSQCGIKRSNQICRMISYYFTSSSYVPCLPFVS
jgi:hypothetical protein